MKHKLPHSLKSVRSAVVVNRRPFLGKLAKWISESDASVSVILSSSVAMDQPLEFARLNEVCGSVIVVENYEDPSVEDLILDVCGSTNAESLLSTTEIDIMRCARVRKQLSIEGQSVESATAYRNKWVMKSLAASAGTPVARMARYKNKDELALLEASRSQIVIKPLLGAASIDMHIVDSFSTAMATLEKKQDSEKYLLEEFVSHDMYHVDGLMLDGHVIQSWPSVYLYNNFRSMYESKPLLTGQLEYDNALAVRLMRVNDHVISSLPAASGLHAFHAEYFLSGDDKIVLCEIASRAGGAGTAEVYERSFGTSQYEEPIRYGLGCLQHREYSTFPLTRFGYGWFLPESGVVERAPAGCEMDGIVRFESRLTVGAITRPPAFSTEAVVETVFRMGD